MKRLSTVAPLPFIMGGLAEDALLYHRVTAQHADLDLLVVRDQLNQQLQELMALGLVEAAGDLKPAPGHPLILKTGADSLPIEIWICALESSGEYHLDVGGQAASDRFRVFLPKDTFQYPATMIGDIAIQTISPMALCHLRAVSAMTRSTGEKRAQDLAMRELLLRTFLADQDESKLIPKLETL